MNELNEKAINMCQAMIGFKPGVSDGDIDTAISTVTSLPMFAGLNKIELKKSLLSIYKVQEIPGRTEAFCPRGYLPTG